MGENLWVVAEPRQHKVHLLNGHRQLHRIQNQHVFAEVAGRLDVVARKQVVDWMKSLFAREKRT